MAKAFQRSYKFLPEVFQSPINRRFLSSTMDQLVIPGDPRQLNYYIGRKYAKSSKIGDRFLQESNDLRNAYQLETGAAVRDPDGTYSFGATVEDFINILDYYGVDKNNIQTILKDDFKPADFKINLDKLINYEQYYWIPDGPQSVTVNFSAANDLFTRLTSLGGNVTSYFDDNYWYATTDNTPSSLVDNFPNSEVNRSISTGTVTFKIPRNPSSLQTQNQLVVPPASMVGTATNGHPFYTFTMGSKEKLGEEIYTINTVYLENHSVTFTSEAYSIPNSFDRTEDVLHVSPTDFNGHPDVNGVFHYHAFSSSLNDTTAGQHSRILGFAFDGFPIYGPRMYANADGTGGVVNATSSYRLKSATANRGTPDGRYVEDYEYIAGLGTLDANNGRFTVTPDFPNGTYAYFLTVDGSNNPVFPYVVGPNWTGNVIQQSGNVIIPGTATKFEGIPTIDVDRDIVGQQRFSVGDITFMNGLKIRFDNSALPATYRNKEYYVEGVGASIQLVSVDSLVSNGLETPTNYSRTDEVYDQSAYDTSEYSGTDYNIVDKHYITIARSSIDGNPWSRSNRWVHYRVLEHTAEILDQPVVVDQVNRARRPIIEFDGNLALYDHARNNIAVVDLIDQYEVDALSNVTASAGFTVDGISLADGMKVVFAADSDLATRNKVYEVSIANLDEGRKSTYSVDPLPADGDSPTAGPYDWLENTSTYFNVEGDFRTATVEIKRDGVLLNEGADYTKEVVYTIPSVISITVTDGGSGYGTAPVVTITDLDSNPVAATAVATISAGAVTGITVTDPTTSSSAVLVTIAAPGGSGSTATAFATIGTERRLEVTLASGSASTSVIEVTAFEYQPNIVLTEIASANEYDGVVVTQGDVNAGKNYYYLDNQWNQGQAKTTANQDPLFDLVNENLVSVGDRSVYTGSTFIGNKLFAYKRGTGTNDTELGFPLSYKSVGLTGDIQFEWNHSTEVFSYTSGAVTTEMSCESFYARNVNDDSLRGVVLDTNRLATLPAFDLRYIDVETNVVDLKVSALEDATQQTVVVELNDKPLYRGVDYDLIDRVVDARNQARDLVKAVLPNSRLVFRNTLKVNDKLLIAQWTNDDISQTDLSWKLPLSITTNPSNTQITQMTFGELAAHLTSGAQLINTLNGNPLGDNNLFVEPLLNTYCSKFGYHNGNSLLAMALLKNRTLGFVQSLEYARNEFTKFKNSIVQRYENVLYDEDNIIPSMLDNLLSDYVLGKSETSPFYDSDMLPGFTNYTSKSYTVRYQQDKTYPLTAAYNDDETSRVAILVYHNGTLLTRYQDYDFDNPLPSLTIKDNYSLSQGDTILVREYSTTTGNWIPVTPAKLGLAPSYRPTLMTVQQPSGEVNVIRGHDGSLTPAFNDQRDELILEFENRIYNNIKSIEGKTYEAVLDKFDLLPGAFRSSDDDYSNYINIVDRFFGQWVIKGRLNYTSNAGSSTDEWKWNYRNQRDAYGNTVKVGNWSGIYRFYFDTEYPNKTPWEMLGFSEEPTWWQDEYGPAPYTSQNFKLWDDLEQGLIRSGTRAGFDVRYARVDPNGLVKLKNVIPVDDHGSLVSPAQSKLVRVIDPRKLSADWIFGDGGPVEQAWTRSSEFAFAKQLYLSLVNARLYFGAAFDLLDTRFDPVTDTLLKVYNTTITSAGRVIRADDINSSVSGTNLSGYFVWLQARASALNINNEDFSNFVTGICPRLMFRMTGFTDKDKLQIFINSVAPGSTNALNLLPDSNYQLLLDRSSPTSTLIYSGVIVTRTSNGWRIEGYDTEKSYFYILPSIQDEGSKDLVRVGEKAATYLTWAPNSQYIRGQIVEYANAYFKVLQDHISSASFALDSDVYNPLQSLPTQGGIIASLWKNYSGTPSKVYYGTNYRTAQEVFDFLISYGRYLSNQGFIFDQFNSELGEIKDWLLSGKEFLFWSLQNWNPGASITLSPSSQLIQLYIPQGDLDPLYGVYSDPDTVLDQNGTPLKSADIVIDRNFDVVTIAPMSSAKTIYLLKAVVSECDHLVVFDSTTDFNDIVFDATTGARQDRLKIKGSKSNGWNGKLFAPGYTLDQAIVIEWSQYTDYTIGDLVKVGTTVYSAIVSHNSEELFDYAKWNKLVNQPTKFLQPNLETMAARLEQFYDLNVDQITSDVSSYARHLIGFQPRSYLQDLLVDDETQFKFYQGMITQKGTAQAVTKLLRGTNPGGIPTVDLKDEWALRVGEVGLADNTDEIEIQLTSSDLDYSSVALDLENNVSYERNIIAIAPEKILDKGEKVLPNIFPLKDMDFLQKDAGYARIDQVDATVLFHSQLSTVSTSLINQNGSVIWVAKTPLSDSAIYRTQRFGPYTVTIYDGDVVGLDDNIQLSPDEGIWFVTIETLNTGAGLVQPLGSIDGYYTVAEVNSLTRFTLVEGTGLEVGSTFTAFIVKLLPVEYPTFNTVSTDTITAINNAVPAKVTFSAAHSFSGGERVIIDNVQGMTELNAGIFYVKYVSATAVSLYYDADLIDAVNSQAYTTYTSGGTMYSSDVNVAERLVETQLGQRIWVDDYDGGWAVMKKQSAWTASSQPDGLTPFATTITKFGSKLHAWSYRSIIWFAGRANILPVATNTNNAVLVFERTASDQNLTLAKIIRGEQPDVSDACDFGYAISHMDQDTLVIGCPNNSERGTKWGSVQIWNRDISGSWNLVYTVDAPVGNNNANFGGSMARVSDEVLLIGAPGESKIYRLVYGSFSLTMSNATQTNPAVVTFTDAHGLSSGQMIHIDGVSGMTQLNNRDFYVEKISYNSVALYTDSSLSTSVNGAAYDPYTSGGIGLLDNDYRITETSTGVVALNQGIAMASDSNRVAIADTDVNGHVRVYTVSEQGDLTLVNEIDGTADIPIKSQHPIDITVYNGLIQVVIGSRFTTYDLYETTLDVGGTTFDTLVEDGVVRIYEVSDTAVELTQVLLAPDQSGQNLFGKSVQFTSNGRLLIGNPTSPAVITINFDSTTTFDNEETLFQDLIEHYGSVESYGWYLNQFVREGDIVNPISYVTDSTTGFGSAIIESNNTIFTASPWSDRGKVYEYANVADGWLIESQQEQLVNTDLVNRALSYDGTEDAVVNFVNLWDPLKNLHDSEALVNLDYITAIDPASYQEDLPGNTYWAEEQVGATWWDNSASIWLWYEQGELGYRMRNWGRMFPGSQVVVSEWIESTVTPSAYNVDNASPELGLPPSGFLQPYNTKITTDANGGLSFKYYFWVANKQSISQSSSKTQNVASISNALVNGPYQWVAPVSKSGVVTKNLQDNLTDGEQILQIELLRVEQNNPRHVEWLLLSEDDSLAPPTSLVNKMVDSLTGKDIQGNMVPDVALPNHKKLGTKIRPRQTMFMDRITAVETSTEFINEQLAKIIIEDIDLGDLNAVDPVPLAIEIVDIDLDDGDTTLDDGSTTLISNLINWVSTVPTYADIIQDDLLAAESGYKILVENDETKQDFWTIYEWDGTQLVLLRVQKYDTTRYWSRVDYYSSSFPIGSIPDATVSTEEELMQGDYVGQAVKVLGPGYWRVLTPDTNNEISILAMENGTIKLDITKADFDSSLAFDTSSFDTLIFDPEPTIELRNILNAMRDNIFVGENQYLWNSWFFSMVRYALSEQRQLDWAFKSSFIKVKNTVAALEERPVYALDVDNSLEDYIKEVKPYHTKIREYTVAYNRTDVYDSMATDFDCPPHLVGSTYVRSNVKDQDQADLFENEMPWRSYKDNRGYHVIAIVVTNGGSGYVTQPTITLSGGVTLGGNNAKPATATALLGLAPQNYTSLGDNNYFSFQKVWLDKQASVDDTINTNDLPNGLLSNLVGSDSYAIKRIEIVNSGEGYLTPPEVIISGGGGTGATAYAVLGATPVRMFRTGLRFDRVKGTSDILYSDVRDPSLDNPGFDDWHAAERIAAYYTGEPGQQSLPERVTVAHIGDGSTVEFALPQDFMYEELLHVAVDAELVDPSDYTVHPSARLVEFHTAPATGSRILLILNPPLSSLMLGADFDKTKLVGPRFSVGPGFDSQSRGFDSVEFDNWELDPNGDLIELAGIDTYQESGRFSSVSGLDVTTSGGDFLGPDVIPATEELISGQVFDTMDLKVFTKPLTSQAINIQTIEGDGTNDTFELTSVPFSLDNITVFINGLIVAAANFTVDYTTSEIIFATPPLSNSIVSIVVTEDSGPTVEQVRNFVADGTSQLFRIDGVGATDPLRASIVVVDGVKTAHTMTNDGLDLVFDLGSPPAAGSNIRIVVYMQVEGSPTPTLKSYSESFMQTITMDGSSVYTLDHEPGVPAPLSASTIVYVVDGNDANPLVRVGQRLTPSDTAYYVANGESQFTLPDCPGFTGKLSLVDSDLQVAVDGELLNASQYNVVPALDVVTFATTPATGSVVTITVLPSGDYYTVGDQLHVNATVVQTSASIDTVIQVNTYNDSALTDLRTEVFSHTSAVHIYYNGFGVYGGTVLQNLYARGQIRLTNDAFSVNQINVFKNGVFLSPGQGWTLQPGTRDIINVVGGISDSDTIVVHYFAGSATDYMIGFRIFKDMLGRLNYYRIAQENSAVVAQAVTETDNTIYFEDVTGLQTPTATKPGVIMLGKERIEYRTLGMDNISNLRRGTHGTSVQTHDIGDLATDIGSRNLLPPSDIAKNTTAITDGSTASYALPVLLDTSIHSTDSIQVYLGGRKVTSGYTVDDTAGNYDQVTFDVTPKAGMRVVILVKQAANWYDISQPDLWLGDTNTIWAKFIREKRTVLDLS